MHSFTTLTPVTRVPWTSCSFVLNSLGAVLTLASTLLESLLFARLVNLWISPVPTLSPQAVTLQVTLPPRELT